MIEYEVLNELRPHDRLRFLEILYYKGTKFPSWIGDPSFEQLTELTLHGCKSTHLPTLGQLSSLTKLFVESMTEVKTLGIELLAPTNSSISIAFPSLEILKFDDMQSWERWSTSGGDNHGTSRSFPRLNEISIKNCPKLAEVSIGFIPSLRVLHLKECSEAVLRSIVSVSSSLVVLKIWNVKGLTQLHGEDLMHLGELEDLYIEDCDELRYLCEPKAEECNFLTRLQKLEVRSCKRLVSLEEKEVNLGINMEFVKQVILYDCDTLESYNCRNRVERLVIDSCDSLKSLTFSTGRTILEKGFSFSSLFCLRSLQISHCKNINSFPHDHLQHLTSLKQLKIHDCPSIDYSFPSGFWPPNLGSLVIGCLRKPMSKWGLQNFPTSLVELTLGGKNSGVVSFKVTEDVGNTTSSSFLLPTSLASLSLNDFMDVESLSEVLQYLPCLRHLHIWSCPKFRDLPETTSEPSSLTLRVGP